MTKKRIVIEVDESFHNNEYQELKSRLVKVGGTVKWWFQEQVKKYLKGGDKNGY